MVRNFILCKKFVFMRFVILKIYEIDISLNIIDMVFFGEVCFYFLWLIINFFDVCNRICLFVNWWIFFRYFNGDLLC